MLLTNNLLLVVSTAAVLLGTLYPLIYEVITDGEKISVGPPYFNRVFVPITLLLLLAMMVGPFSRWRRTDSTVLLNEHWPLLAGSPVLVVAITLISGVSLEPVAIVIETIGLWILLLLGKNWQLTVKDGWRVPSASYVGMVIGHGRLRSSAAGA